ncbi:hypothetical protein AVEN_137064-1 [Araneus ventricosus]|uniref:Mutator-like transposase domain-containing protein n=1 Tax=Araneus ventricosus TaxID=182803 RepID=A0A4Y2XAM3_ARAVE|nr:hypothetical protein AVEN_137064-1 [Araneus ventricosus]
MLICSRKQRLETLKKKLEGAANDVASNVMKEAALELRKAGNGDDIIQCGVSVDGAWQRRGNSSLNGCVSAISIDTGKILDIELMSKICRFCKKVTSANINNSHNCAKHTGSGGFCQYEATGAKLLLSPLRLPNIANKHYIVNRIGFEAS